MNWNDMVHGMGFGWLFGLLILVLVVLAIAALTKYLRK
jgi:Na+-transporting methylmalonyl-CoA/oxaloacetate decarboxylase gamma subunit